MVSELTRCARIALDLIDKHDLPVVWFGSGVGGPSYLDVDVASTAEIEQWAEVLGVPARLEATGLVIRTEFEGLQVRVGTRHNTEVE